ncbi:MAG: exodeoxyribonuclease VII small subunit [Butyricicoccus sp.]
MASRKKVSFEQAMSRLEEIVGLLEHGEASLEESMALFEEGTKLSVLLHEMLEKAEQKILVLAQDKNGDFEEKAFDTEGDVI